MLSEAADQLSFSHRTGDWFNSSVTQNLSKFCDSFVSLSKTLNPKLSTCSVDGHVTGGTVEGSNNLEEI